MEKLDEQSLIPEQIAEDESYQASLAPDEIYEVGSDLESLELEIGEEEPDRASLAPEEIGEEESDRPSLTPDEISNLAKETTGSLLPEISRKRYETAYQNFVEWKSRNGINSFSENTLVDYFGEISESYKSSTLWSIYSMLRGSIVAKHDINIAAYSKLRAVLKRKSRNYAPKKISTLNPEQIKKFINCAPDELFLLTKVALVFGISGSMRKSELWNIRVQDITEVGSSVVVKIPNMIKNKPPRTFTIEGEFYHTYKKYSRLRPMCQHDKFFVSYQKGRCTDKVVGINKFGNMVKDIAKYLKLENANSYTGHSFRRSSATSLVDASGRSSNTKKAR